MNTGSESIEAIIRRRRILFAGYVARMGGHETAEVRDARRTGGGVGSLGGQ